MLEKPNVAYTRIIAEIESHYKTHVKSLEFLPVGNDQRAWAYRVYADTGDFFLKLRKGGTRQASLVAPHYLRSQGINQVVAPLATSSGKLLVAGDEFDLILYPFIEGKSAWRMALTLAQWHSWGEILRRIHSTALSPQLAEEDEREVFGLKWLRTLEEVEDVLRRRDFKSEVAAAMARLWQEKAQVIELSRQRYLALGARLTADPPRFVICHADIHTANIMIDKRGLIHIVDWDEAVIAPKERDLMFFINDSHSPEEEVAFFEGYADDCVNWHALAYYKYDWVIQEFGDYGERVFLSEDIGAKDLDSALVEFKRLFADDDVIDIAERTYAKFLEVSGQ